MPRWKLLYVHAFEKKVFLKNHFIGQKLLKMTIKYALSVLSICTIAFRLCKIRPSFIATKSINIKDRNTFAMAMEENILDELSQSKQLFVNDLTVLELLIHTGTLFHTRITLMFGYKKILIRRNVND